ncbi:MAG: hypothetical protein GC138_02710 [Gammaproteobacteria bacterium]|nr:hypothetical protein [Gammaproteobacteria bacterium]
MMDDMDQQHYLALARSLVSDLERGQCDDAERTLEEITRLRKNASYEALDRLIALMDEAPSANKLDATLGQILTQEIPEIIERLNYVDDMINDSASKTLNHVERCLEACELVKAGASAEVLNDLKAQTHDLSQGLNEILLAQSFQDLSGQVLSRVIDMVGGIERYMVQLLNHNAHEDRTLEGEGSVDRRGEAGTEPYGPRIPGLENPEMLKDQGEVDDLLSSMGF